MAQQTAAERLAAWNEGAEDVAHGYEPDALDWQRDLRAVLEQRAALLAACRVAIESLREEMPRRAEVVLVDAIAKAEAV